MHAGEISREHPAESGTGAAEGPRAALADMLFQVIERFRLAGKAVSRPGGPALTMREYCALSALRYGRRNAGALRRLLGVHATQMARVLSRLEEGVRPRLTRCAINREDRRRKDVALTRAGRRAADRYRKQVLGSGFHVLAQFSDADCRCLLRMLRRLDEALVRHLQARKGLPRR